jgi:hypothetical protein
MREGSQWCPRLWVRRQARLEPRREPFPSRVFAVFVEGRAPMRRSRPRKRGLEHVPGVIEPSATPAPTTVEAPTKRMVLHRVGSFLLESHEAFLELAAIFARQTGDRGRAKAPGRSGVSERRPHDAPGNASTRRSYPRPFADQHGLFFVRRESTSGAADLVARPMTGSSFLAGEAVRSRVIIELRISLREPRRSRGESREVFQGDEDAVEVEVRGAVNGGNEGLSCRAIQKQCSVVNSSRISRLSYSARSKDSFSSLERYSAKRPRIFGARRAGSHRELSAGKFGLEGLEDRADDPSSWSMRTTRMRGVDLLVAFETRARRRPLRLRGT